MLYVGYHGRTLQVVLLHRVLGTQGKKRRGRTIACKTAGIFYCRDRLIGDVFCSHIPGPSFTGDVSLTIEGCSTATHPFKNCTIFPFLDQAIHFGIEDSGSDRFKTRIARGVSLPGGFDILQTLRSPLADCVASISDFCFDEEACQASEVMGDGPRDEVKVCKMVKIGRRVDIKMDPFWYLQVVSSAA